MFGLASPEPHQEGRGTSMSSYDPSEQMGLHLQWIELSRPDPHFALLIFGDQVPDDLL